MPLDLNDMLMKKKHALNEKIAGLTFPNHTGKLDLQLL